VADRETTEYRLPSAPSRRRAGATSVSGPPLDGHSSSSAKEGKPPADTPAYDLDVGAYPEGGVEAVLERMATLARDGARDPRIRALAHYTTEAVSEDARTGQPDRTDRRAVAEALYELVVQAVEYTHDPHDVELLQSPRATFLAGAGDCDDMATAGAALLGAMGAPTRFQAIGTDPSRPEAFTHVYAEFQDEGGEWVTFDAVGNPGLGADIAPGRVTTRLTKQVHSVGGGPQELAVLTAEDVSGESAGSSLAGTAGALADDPPQGPVDGPYAWVQIIDRSHSGSVPEEERFTVTLRVERSYPLLVDCDIRVVAERADSGEELTRTSFTGSKWTDLSADRCGSDARLTFPLDFAPTGTPVVLKVYDTDWVSGSDLLGESGAFYLTEEEVTEPQNKWDDVRDAAAAAQRIFEGLLTVGMVAGGGFALSAGWPYVERVLPDFTDDE